MSGTNLGELIGKGGFSKVYKLQGNPQKVVKVTPFTNLNIVKSTIKSLDISCRIKHPNVVSTESFSFGDDDLRQVMERAIGDLKENPPKTPEEIVDVVLQVGSALITLHRLGVYHRDIKPQNILLFEGGIVKIADFDTVAYEDVFDIRKGTPNYLPPEDSPLPSKHDSWSFGILIFFLTTQKTFSNVSKTYTVEGIRDYIKKVSMSWKSTTNRETFFGAWGVPEELLGIVVKLTEPNPSLRPTIEDVFIEEGFPYEVGIGYLSLPAEREALCDDVFTATLKNIILFSSIEKLSVLYLAIELMYRAYPTTKIANIEDYIYIARIFHGGDICLKPSKRVLKIITDLRGILMSETWYTYAGNSNTNFKKLIPFISNCKEYLSFNKKEIVENIV